MLPWSCLHVSVAAINATSFVQAVALEFSADSTCTSVDFISAVTRSVLLLLNCIASLLYNQ